MATSTPRRHPLLAFVLSIGTLLLAVVLPGFVNAQTPAIQVTITDLGPLLGDGASALEC